VTRTDQPDRQPFLLRDAQVIRALSHPARVAILMQLTDGREATATECSELCGLSPSATSYHLRALAKLGLIEEAPGRGDARERVWRSATAGLLLDSGVADTPEELSAATALMTLVLDRDDRVAREWMQHADATEPREWSDASGVVRLTVTMTAEELAAVQKTVKDLIDQYSRRARPDPPPGARRVTMRFQAFPD
jgi:DNA-binding transcriptional ArsR family regulator